MPLALAHGRLVWDEMRRVDGADSFPTALSPNSQICLTGCNLDIGFQRQRNTKMSRFIRRKASISSNT